MLFTENLYNNIESATNEALEQAAQNEISGGIVQAQLCVVNELSQPLTYSMMVRDSEDVAKWLMGFYANMEARDADWVAIYVTLDGKQTHFPMA